MAMANLNPKDQKHTKSCWLQLDLIKHNFNCGLLAPETLHFVTTRVWEEYCAFFWSATFHFLGTKHQNTSATQVAICQPTGCRIFGPQNVIRHYATTVSYNTMKTWRLQLA